MKAELIPTGELSPVSFHGDTIFCIDYKGQPFTAMKPIVENMGLNWASQSVKLKANKERWGVVMIATPSDGGEQRTLSMPVRKLPSYFNSINPKKVHADLRPKIELYQNESDDALWAYWMEGRAVRVTQPQPAATQITPAQCRELHNILDAKLSQFPAEVQGKARSEAWTRLKRKFKVARYEQLPTELYAEAMTYLINMQIKAALAARTTQALPSPTPSLDEYGRHVDNVLVALAPFRRNIAMDAQLDAGSRRLGRRELWPFQQALFDAVGANAAAIESSRRLMDIAREILIQV